MDEVRWLRNGADLIGSRHLSWQDECRATIELYNVDHRDEGEYALEIVSTHERSAPARLFFEVAPKIALRKLYAADEDNALTVNAGNELTFEVRFLKIIYA